MAIKDKDAVTIGHRARVILNNLLWQPCTLQMETYFRLLDGRDFLYEVHQASGNIATIRSFQSFAKKVKAAWPERTVIFKISLVKGA
jgi:hypothetical protein